MPTFGREGAAALAELAMAITDKDALVAAANDFLEGAPDASPETAQMAVEVLAPAIAAAHGDALVAVAVVIGLLAERGADPGIAAITLTDRLGQLLRQSSALATAARAENPAKPDEDDEAEFRAARARVALSMPNEGEAWDVLERMLGPSIAIYGTSAEGRSRAAALLPDLEELAHTHQTAHWLRRFLIVLYDEPFVALEPATQSGIRGRMSGISENFQLNVLLMDAMPRTGFLSKARVSKAAVDVAMGSGPQVAAEQITGAWDLMTWRAARPDGSLPKHGASDYDEELVIWNEGTPSDIPVFEGERVILLGPPSYARRWQSQRDFPSLAASLGSIEKLSRQDVSGSLQRMVAASRDIRQR
jgi:hypothetical protein